jgi:hypothetical protein
MKEPFGNGSPAFFVERGIPPEEPMTRILPILALLILAACEAPPEVAVSPQEQKARDDEHSSIRQERAQQEYWEWERGGGRR